MNPKLRTALIGLGYSSWFAFVFVLLTWITFPWGRVQEQAMVAAADAGWALGIDDMGPAFVGVKAKGVTLAKAAPADAEEPPRALLQLDKVKLKTGAGGALSAGLALRSVAAEGGVPLDQLIQQVLDALGEVKLDGRLYGGKLRATATGDEEAARFVVDGEDLDLTTYVIEMEKFGADPTGRLQADADVTWHWEDPKKTSGNIDLVIDALSIRDLKFGFFGLPETTFSRSEAHLKLGRGKAEFRDTVFEADEVQLHVDGFISLNKSLMRSRLALKLRFKLREDLDGLTKVAFGSDPSHKDEDGWYHYQASGMLSRPRLRPSATAARGGRRSAARNPTRTLDGDDDDDTVPDKARTPRRQTPRDKVEREPLSEQDQVERDAARERLADERRRRREERRERREAAIARRRARQAQLDDAADGRGGEEAPQLNPQLGPDDIEVELEDPDLEFDEEIPEDELPLEELPLDEDLEYEE